MIDIKIKYTKELEPYSFNRAKEKYVNGEIKEKKSKEHTQIWVEEILFSKFDEIVEISKEIFENTYGVFFDDYQKKINYIKIIIANEKILEDSEEYKIFTEKIMGLLQSSEQETAQLMENGTEETNLSDEIDINQAIAQNKNDVADNINKKTVELEKAEKQAEREERIKKANKEWENISELEPEERLKEIPILIKPESAKELSENKEIIENIKIELEVLERYQYKLSNNSHIMALIFIINKKQGITELENGKILLKVSKNHFYRIYNKFQDLTKADISLKTSLISYFHLDESENLKRKKEIINMGNVNNVEDFYKLQLKIIKTKIACLDYFFSLTDNKNKEIVKFKEIRSKEKKKIFSKRKSNQANIYYQLVILKKQIERVFEWDLLGINNLELGEKK